MFNKQTLRFAVAGLVGALIAALIAECVVVPFFPTELRTSKSIPVDIAFIVDNSGSMGDEIAGVKTGLEGFVTSMNKQVGPNGEPLLLDWRVGFITIGDKTPPYRLIPLDGQFLDNDPSLLHKAIDPMRPDQGGSEYCWDAMNAACGPGYFRDEAQKVLIMIGDEEPQGTVAEASVIKSMERRGISQLHFVVASSDKARYEKLRGSKPIPGEFADIASVSDSAAFAQLMPKLAGDIRSNFPPDLLKADGSAGGKSNFTLLGLLKVMLVSALIAAGISLALITVQSSDQGHGYLISKKQFFFGGGGGVLAGAIAGGIAQSGFAITSASLPIWLPLILGWAVLGGLVGGALKFFVPNLGFARGIIGGLVGGGLGGTLFLVLSNNSGIMGRSLGFMAMGFCIGLMVAVALQMLREFWLEVYYSQDQVTRRFPLGREPISIGSQSCTVYAPGPPVAFKYRVEEGKVLKQAGGGNSSVEVSQGDAETVGSVKLTVGAQAAVGSPGATSKASGVFEAEIVANPSDATVLGVKNVGATSWDIQIPGSGARSITPGQSLKLVDGTQIATGGHPALEINRSPNNPSVFGLKNLTTRQISCKSSRTNKDLSPGQSMQIHLGLKMKG